MTTIFNLIDDVATSIVILIAVAFIGWLLLIWKDEVTGESSSIPEDELEYWYGEDEEDDE